MSKKYLKNFYKKITAVLLICVYSLQMTTAVAMSSATPTSTIAENTEVNQTIANSATPMTLPPICLTTDTLGISGPLYLGTTYDTLLGTVFNGQYTQKITDISAISALGEYGSDQYRLNGTAGLQLYPQGQIKFSGEYLSQVLPFSFDSGDIEERVGQSAYGFNFQHNVNNIALQHINLGGYWAKAPNVSLDTLNFTAEDGYDYINQRNLAGATSQGLDFGGTLSLTPMTSLDVAWNYDDVYYNTELVSNDSYNTSGMGITLNLNQLIGERMKFSAEASNRAIYNTYGAELAYAPVFAQPIGLKMGLFIQRLVSSNDTPSSNTYGLQLSFLGDNVSNTPYSLGNTSTNIAIEEWVKNPAVYMDRVMITAEQITTLAAATVSSIIPSSGPIEGGNTVTVNGTNFFPTTQVFFNGQPGVVTFISPHQLSVVVPSLVFTGVRTMDTGFSQSVDVTIDNPDGQSTVFSSEYTYTEANATITDISPNVGSVDGGTSVTITGTDFVNTTSVTFGGAEATDITVDETGTSITVNTPAHVAGIVDVVVNTPAGTVTQSNSFTYNDAPTIDSITPSSGPTDAGTSVAIVGTNFITDATTVTIGGNPATNVSVSDASHLTADAPAGTEGTANVIVTTSGGSATLTDGYTYTAAPTIISITPNAGPTDAGTSVAIVGSNFISNATTVTIGGNPATNVSVTDATHLTADAPAGTLGAANVIVTTSGGSATLTGGYTYVNPAIIYVSTSSYTGNLGGLTGADQKCNSDSNKPSTGFAANYQYKALLNGNNATTSGVKYYRVDGTTLIAEANGGNLVGAASLINTIPPSGGYAVWTGYDGTNSCSNWNSSFNTTTNKGATGTSTSKTSTYWASSAFGNCSTPRGIYCVSQ